MLAPNYIQCLSFTNVAFVSAMLSVTSWTALDEFRFLNYHLHMADMSFINSVTVICLKRLWQFSL